MRDLTRGRRRFANDDPFRGELGDWEALRRLALYMRPLAPMLATGLALTLLWSSINLGQGWMVERFFKTIEAKQGSGNISELNFWAVVAMAAFIFRGALYFAYNFAWSYAGQRLSMRLRDEVFSHLQELPLAFFDRRRTGQLLSVLSNDIPAINTVLAAIQDFLSAPIALVGGSALLIYLNWRLTLVCLICLPPIAWIIVKASAMTRRCSTRVQESLAEISGHAEEKIAGVRIVRAFANEEFERNRFQRHSMQVMRSMLRTLRVRYVMVPLVELLGTIAIILVCWVAGREIISQESDLDVPRLLWYVMVLRTVAEGAKNIGGISVNLASAGVAANRVFTLLDQKNDVSDPPEPLNLDHVRGHLRLENVSFAYSAGIPVLKEINLEIRSGEVVAVVGPTGSGKTTIASLIPRFYDVSGGRITVDGIDVRDCTRHALRSLIGIVPQDTSLFAGTLGENIAYGRLEATDEEVEQAARLANAWEFIERLPDGLNTTVGERGTRLSGGQRQRIAIARAILRDPKILILDEATSSLDAQSEALVQDALQRLMTNRTTLVIAHRLSTIRNADRIVVLREGRIVESGRHEELLALKGVYSRLYETQYRADGLGVAVDDLE